MTGKLNPPLAETTCGLLATLLLVCCSSCQYLNKPESARGGENPSNIPPAQQSPRLRSAFGEEPSGSMVLSVGDETITAKEIVDLLVDRISPLAQQVDFENFKGQLKPQLKQIVVNKVSDIILYQKARKKLGEQTESLLNKAVETEIRKFIASFGGDYAKAENQLKQMGTNWKNFRKLQKKLIISQSYISSIMPKDEFVTHKQLLNTYNKMKETSFTTPAAITIRLIDIQPDKLDLPEANINRKKYAVNLAYKILLSLKKGNGFAELAKKYSHGYRATYGGLWESRNPQSLAKPYDILGQKTENMKPGQITGPIQTGNHIFIMKLEQKKIKTVTPLQKIQKQVENKIRFERRQKAINKINKNIAKEASRLTSSETGEKFINVCLRKLYIALTQ